MAKPIRLEIVTNPNVRDRHPLQGMAGWPNVAVMLPTVDLAHRMVCEAAHLWAISNRAGSWRDMAQPETLTLADALAEAGLVEFTGPS